MFTNEVRDRIAVVLYGDGDELSWVRALQLADLLMWELSVEVGE